MDATLNLAFISAPKPTTDAGTKAVTIQPDIEAYKLAVDRVNKSNNDVPIFVWFH